MPRKKADVRGEFPPKLLEWVTKSGVEVTEEVEKAINRVLHDRKKRVQVFLTALAKRQIERIVYLIGQFPVVEKELFRPNRIAAMRSGDLIRLFATVGSQVDGASEFLQQFVSSDEMQTDPPIPLEPKVIDVEEVSAEEKEAAHEMSLESRRRVGRVLKKLLNTLDIVEREEKTKELPEPKEKKS